MKLQEAIEIQTDLHDYFFKHANTDIKSALKLGIEALKHFQKGRTTGALGVSRLLPGETKD